MRQRYSQNRPPLICQKLFNRIARNLAEIARASVFAAGKNPLLSGLIGRCFDTLFGANRQYASLPIFPITQKINNYKKVMKINMRQIVAPMDSMLFLEKLTLLTPNNQKS